MSNHLTPAPRRLQNAIVIAGLVGGAASVVTFFLMAMVFMLAGLQYGHPLAMLMGQPHLTPFRMPQAALDGAAWLLLITAYASLLISIPAFFILYRGGDDAN